MLISDVVGGQPRPVIAVAPRDTITDVVDLLKEHGIGAVVVTEDGAHIDGIISERDVVRHLANELEGTLRLPVEELMTRTVTTTKMSDDIDDVMATMTAGKFRHIPIVSESDTLLSIVSLGDLVTARLLALEREYEKLTSQQMP